MFNWHRPKPAAALPRQAAASFFGIDRGSPLDMAQPGQQVLGKLDGLIAALPQIAAATGAAQDSSDGGPALKMAAQSTALSEMLALWYASQGFIGHQFCAILAQHWLIDKACSMPGRDAIRNGYDIVSADGDALDPQVIKLLRRHDRQMRIDWNLEQFVRMGRVFGIRIAFFRVDSTDPDYYEKPYNPDGVTPGSYKGLVQVDPYWCAPQLDQAAVSRPDTMHFYEPTWWLINGRRYHRSHLVIYRHREPPDLLKPQYLYGGIPVPQLIMERVYAAERVANEAPELAMTKRTTVWQTNMSEFIAKGAQAIKLLNDWVRYRNNYGVKIGDKDGDQFSQFDTSLSDLDAVIMTEYQIVAAAANVPATKLLGTTPKGFNATGEYEESNYHEELESIQKHDLTPLIERHHELVMRSAIIPALGGAPLETTVSWRTLDTPTAKELADTNLVKAQTGAALIQSGALSSEDERRRIAADPDGGYHSLDLQEMPTEDPEDEPPDDGGCGGYPVPQGGGDDQGGNGKSAPTQDAQPADDPFAAMDAVWHEEDHDRKAGKFAPKGSGSSGSSGSSEEGGSNDRLPSSAGITTHEQARAYWDTHLGGKTFDLSVHSKKRDPIAIKVRFSADNDHAYTSDVGGEDKTGKRGFNVERAQAMSRIPSVIEHPQKRMRSYDSTLLLEAPVGGKHYTVVLVWEGKVNRYLFQSAHFRPIEEVGRMHQSPKKNGGPL